MTARALEMTWTNLAFLHWPVRAELLRPMIPIQLDIDVHGDDGMAWIGVVPFEMRGVKPLGLSIPTATDFPELNVRTYVTHEGVSGVWFFSLDAASWLAVVGARAGTGLPYHHAEMKISEGPDGSVTYESERTGSPVPPANFQGTYKPEGSVFHAKEGTFEHWSTHRMTLFSQHQMRTLLRLDIEHAPWLLQRAKATITTNTMAAASNIQLPNAPPHVLFAKHLDVVAHLPSMI